MSALTPPIHAMPPPVAPAASGKNSLWALGALTLAGLGGWWMWMRPATQQSPVAVAKTAVVRAGLLENSMRLNGQTSARNFYTVTAPIMRGPEANGSMILQKMAKAGSLVRTGEPLIEIDGQSMADHVDDVKDQLRQGENDVAKRKAEQAVELGQLEQTLRIAKSQLDKARLDFQPAPVRTDVERELLKLAVDEAEARYNQQVKDLAQQKASHAAEIKILESTVARHKIHLGRHEIDLSRFTVRATKPGLVVSQTIFRGGDLAQIEQGDQVYPGMPVLKVVDPASMQVEANVNQAQSSELRIGQRVRIGFDAFPGLQLTGHVYSIGALASSPGRSQFFIRMVPVRIAIDKLDPRVIPDLSAYVDVITAEAENALQVPLNSVTEDGGKSYVFVKGSNGFEKRAVTTGLRSNMQVAVKDGLRAGEEVRVN
jgi:multidrug resistance efflux pump